MTSLMEKQAEKWKKTPLIHKSNQSSSEEREQWLSELRREITFLSVDVATMKAKLKEKEDKLERFIKRKWILEAEQIQVKVFKRGGRIYSKEEKELLDFLRDEAKKKI